MEASTKVRENRVRRAAERQGVALRKSRRRDERADDFGMYWIERDSPSKGPGVLIETDNLADVERWLKGDERVSVLNRDPFWPRGERA